MKISEFSTDKALDVFCELVPYVDSILVDEELIGEIKRKVKLPKGSTRADLLNVGVEKMNKIVPILLKKKRGDIYGILSVLNEKSVEEVGKQNFLVTASQVRELLKDRDLIDFFRSCVDAKKND
jgi:hypothetical protein